MGARKFDAGIGWKLGSLEVATGTTLAAIAAKHGDMASASDFTSWFGEERP